MSTVDLHMHTNASDGTDTPEELVTKIREAGIDTFAVCDHDTIEGAQRVSELNHEGLRFIRGIEFSCIAPITNRKCHILGLNCDYDSWAFKNILKAGEDRRRMKIRFRIEKLNELFGITFTDEELDSLSKIRSVGKPHLANLIVAKGLATDKQDAIDRYINKCKLGREGLSAGYVIKAIIASGGVSVWAHPLGGEGEKELPEEEFLKALKGLEYYGLKGLECWYSKYEPSVCEYLERTAKSHGLYVSGGSDYHGRNKNIPLGKLNAENIIVPVERLTILEII